MEEKNNKRGLKFLGLFFLFGIFLVSFVSAEEINYSYSYDFDGVQITSLKYEPYPVNPSEYFEIWIQAEFGNKDYVKFELIEDFPFSLDDNEEAVREYENAENREVVMKYKVRVDEDAVEGSNELKIGYTSSKFSDLSVIELLEISVIGSQTSFDAVIQESITSEVSSEVSIAIANIGKYTANSVVVRIPEQEAFEVTGTDGQMVGNLDSGDYTIVSFSVTSSMQGNSENTTQGFNPNYQNQKSNLEFDIYYTDELGERRIVNMELPLQMTSGFPLEDGEMPEGFPGRMGQQDSGTNWTLWIIIAILIIVGFVLYKKYPEQTKKIYNKLLQKTKELFDRKKHHENNSEVIPNWIKNHKEKEKKNEKK